MISPEGEQLGVLRIEEALARARERELDLVEVAPNVRPPVCKLMDYGRFKFERDQREKEAKKRQSQIDVKEVKLRPNIGDHDLETKLDRAKSFLEKGNHVKLTIMFRRREMRRPENGFALLARATEHLRGHAEVSQPPPSVLPGRDLSMVLRPSS